MDTYDGGIDLGTTTSCLAVMRDGVPTVIQNLSDGDGDITPSVVRINKKGRVIVGKLAYNYSNQTEVRREFKRDMGTTTVYKFPSGIEKTPVELSAEVLKSIRTAAENSGVRLENVVITTPAAFGAPQDEATKEAGHLAGFSQIMLVQEPVAAAVAYGAQKEDVRDQYWMVFDFGGGTLDVEIVSTYDGQITCVNHDGDPRLGGRDIDKAFMEKVILPKLREEYTLDKPDSSAISQARISAERCKIALSSSELATYTLYECEDDEGEDIDFTAKITRDEFNDAIKDIVDDAVNIARRALIGAKKVDSDLSKIILVGGSSRIPLVAKMLEEEFGITPSNDVDPITAVARGAAIYAGITRLKTDTAQEKKEEPEPDTQVPGEALHVAVKHEDETDKERPFAAGRFEPYTMNAVSEVRFNCIADKEAAGALWTSGWMSVNQERGSFNGSVYMARPDADNTFRIEARDSTGSLVKISNPYFTIRYRKKLHIAAPPLPYYVGVLVTDGSENYIDWLFKKNQQLPLSETREYKTYRDLSPETDSEFRLEIYEGENLTNISANTRVGILHVKGKDLSQDIPAGSRILITLNIDESHIISAKGELPDYNITLIDDQIRNKSEGYLDYEQEILDIEEDMKDVVSGLDELSSAGIDTEENRKQLDSMKQMISRARSGKNIDNDEAADAIDTFRSVQTDVIKQKNEHKEDLERQEQLNQISENAQIINRYGNPAQRERLQILQERYKNEKDPYQKQVLVQAVSSLAAESLFSSTEWLEYMYQYHLSHHFEYEDANQARVYMEQARAAIGKHDVISLSDAISHLQNLRMDLLKKAGTVSKDDLASLRE